MTCYFLASRSTPLSKVMELFRSHRGETTEERQRRKSGGVSTISLSFVGIPNIILFGLGGGDLVHAFYLLIY